MANNIHNWLDIVAGLAGQNGAVRLSLSDKPVDEGGRSARARVLATEADGVTIIEEPGVRDLGTRLRPGTEVDVLAVRHQTRLVGRCRVDGYVKHALNEATRIDAVRLARPVRVFSGQLRDLFRAPIGAGVDVDPVELWLDPDDETTIARALDVGLDPDTIHKARLVNISGGGMGLAILVERAQVPAFCVDTVFTLRAELPMLDKPLDLRSRVVYTETLDNGDLYLGVAFVFDDDALQKRIEDQLQRLSVWLQRRILKKERQN